MSRGAKQILVAARLLEEEPDTLGASSHLLAVASI
jgi:hypothetical protein